jgi:hypothetical protein
MYVCMFYWLHIKICYITMAYGCDLFVIFAMVKIIAGKCLIWFSEFSVRDEGIKWITWHGMDVE